MFKFSQIKKRNICIIGLMGSGKSMIGRDLSKYLKIKFFDTDKEIELKTNKSINSVFSEHGEAYFRDIEEKICLKLLDYNNCVISLGGGSIINTKIRKAIKANSYSIYLKVKISNLLKRLESSKKRPLLNQSISKEATLKKLYKERQRFYDEADFIVNNNYDKLFVLEKIKTELIKYEK